MKEDVKRTKFMYNVEQKLSAAIKDANCVRRSSHKETRGSAARFFCRSHFIMTPHKSGRSLISPEAAALAASHSDAVANFWDVLFFRDIISAIREREREKVVSN